MTDNIPAPIAPAFGGRLNNDAYYANVSSIIALLRPMSSLRIIAEHLTRSGFRTPAGLEFNRDRVANFIKNNSIQISKE